MLTCMNLLNEKCLWFVNYSLAYWYVSNVLLLIIYIYCNVQILEDELENEKGERLRLQGIIDDLKKRPDTVAAVTAAEGFKKRAKTPIQGKTVIQ